MDAAIHFLIFLLIQKLFSMLCISLSTMPVPMYARHPALYCFNTVSKKHMMRGGRAYKKAFAANPDIFVESTAILESDDVVPTAITTPSVLEPVSLPLLPLDPVSPPMDDQKAIEKQRHADDSAHKTRTRAKSETL